MSACWRLHSINLNYQVYKSQISHIRGLCCIYYSELVICDIYQLSRLLLPVPVAPIKATPRRQGYLPLYRQSINNEWKRLVDCLHAHSSEHSLLFGERSSSSSICPLPTQRCIVVYLAAPHPPRHEMGDSSTSSTSSSIWRRSLRFAK